MATIDRLEQRQLLAGLEGTSRIAGIENIDLTSRGTLYVQLSDAGTQVRLTACDNLAAAAKIIQDSGEAVAGTGWETFIYAGDRSFALRYGAVSLFFAAETDAKTGILPVLNDWMPEQPVVVLEVSSGSQVVIPSAFVSRFTVDGGAGNDMISVEARRKTTVRGFGGNDTLVATGRNALLDGGPGRDRLTTTGANSTLLGGSGNDTLITAAGTDQVFGGKGIDRLLDATDTREAVEIIG